MTCFSGLTNDELADEITTLAGRLAAAEARQLELIAEFDRRKAWGGPGLLSCAHWLSWRTGMNLNAARERVRAARALRELPLIAEAFGAGRLSWSKVRAMTRVATPDNESRLVELARHTTAAQLEKAVRGMCRVRKLEEDAADPELAAYRMRTSMSYDRDGNFVLTVRASAEDGAVIRAAIDRVQAELDRQRRAAAEPAGVSAETPDAEGDARHAAETPGANPAAHVPAETPRGDSGAGALAGTRGADDGAHGTPAAGSGADVSAGTSGTEIGGPGLRSVATGAQPSAASRVSAETPARATQAEALLHIARTVLEQQAVEHPAAARRQRAGLVVQVDPLSGWGRLRDGEFLPPTSLQGVMRTLPGRARPRLRPLTRADLTAEDLGRSQREVSLRLRELLGALDGERCRFPGCTRHRNLHAHHVVWWSAGGPTDLANLVLLCARHHTLVHRDGFQLVLHTNRRLTVTTADGVPVLHHPAMPWGSADDLDLDRRIDADTLPPDSITARMSLDYVVSVLVQQAA